MDWFTIIISLLIGFILGRFYPVIRKFGEFLNKENEKKSEV